MTDVIKALRDGRVVETPYAKIVFDVVDDPISGGEIGRLRVHDSTFQICVNAEALAMEGYVESWISESLRVWFLGALQVGGPPQRDESGIYTQFPPPVMPVPEGLDQLVSVTVPRGALLYALCGLESWPPNGATSLARFQIRKALGIEDES
ncbi:MAG: hypothetical protein AAGJ19_22075 [Myxococcota bacterium]